MYFMRAGGRLGRGAGGRWPGLDPPASCDAAGTGHLRVRMEAADGCRLGVVVAVEGVTRDVPAGG